MQALYYFFKAKQSKQKLDAYISEPGQAAGSDNADATGSSEACLAIVPVATQATPVRRARRTSPARTSAPTTMIDSILPYIVLPTFVAAVLSFHRRHQKLCLCLIALVIVAPHLCGVILGTGFEFILQRLWTLVCSFCSIIFDATHNAIASACTAWQRFKIKLANSVRDTQAFKHIRPTWAENPTTQTKESDPSSATQSASPLLQLLEQIWLCVVVFASCFVCRSAHN